MSLYRSRPADGIAWITGASKGIGRELALKLAAQGYTVAASARDEELLESLTLQSAALAGAIISFPCDVTDENAVLATIGKIEKDAGPIVLAIFNAGVYYPTRGDRLDLNNIAKVFETNLFGVMNGLVPMTDVMRTRGKGQIMVVGSVSSFFGWPSASAYGGSKAALTNMVQALRYDLTKMNIRLQIVSPGFVDTPLTQQTSFKMPFVMKPEQAGGRIMRAIENGGFETSFPRRFTWPLRILAALPSPVHFWIMNQMTGWKSRPMAAARKPRIERD